MAGAEWWYLSFADDAAFRGACFVLARDVDDAIRAAAAYGCDVRSARESILAYPVEDVADVPPWRLRNRMLTVAEVDLLATS